MRTADVYADCSCGSLTSTPSSVTFCWSARAPATEPYRGIRRVGVRRRDEHGARLQAEQVHDVAALDRQRRDRRAAHGLADAGVGGVDDGCRLVHRHGFGDATERHLGVGSGDGVDAHRNVFVLEGPKPAELDFERVRPGRKTRQIVGAALVRHRRAHPAGRGVGRGDRRAWEHGSLGVFDRAGQAARAGLSGGKAGNR